MEINSKKTAARPAGTKSLNVNIDAKLLAKFSEFCRKRDEKIKHAATMALIAYMATTKQQEAKNETD